MAVTGGKPSLEAQTSALGAAMAMPHVAEDCTEARLALVEAAGNQHALLDVAAAIAYFSLMTKIVDMNGFYHPSVNSIGVKLVPAIFTGARKIREFIWCIVMFPCALLLWWKERNAKNASK
ncbi:expressed unknown protein [Seminavis robusta]|uniref:Uncharacterized protein n=1 Tax=Seminavis robusta TaxID=568900 RepID=A0A9N8EEJ1_9STRA|nr:expressed unknown protein [Seminavis robusta]|eukprot:Sro962_g225140.1 n/a (121) ;mRNA; f:25092-25454